MQWIGIAAIGSAVAGLFLFNPADGGWLYPACPFRALTGWLCPGCGTLRAMYEMLHGNFGEAVRLNGLAGAGVMIAGMLAVRKVAAAVQRTELKPLAVNRGKWVWAGVVVAAVFGVLRNVL